jgi:hypothetical protein
MEEEVVKRREKERSKVDSEKERVIKTEREMEHLQTECLWLSVRCEERSGRFNIPVSDCQADTN